MAGLHGRVGARSRRGVRAALGVIGAAALLSASACSSAEEPLEMDQVAAALPADATLGDEWSRKDSRYEPVRTGSEGSDACQQETETACSGIVYGGAVSMDREETGENFAHFMIYAFGAPEDAEVAHDALTPVQEQEEDQSGSAKQVELESEAGTVPAHLVISDTGGGAHIWYRIGPTVVLIHYNSSDYSDDEAKKFATIQADRIAAVAAGDNPDAA